MGDSSALLLYLVDQLKQTLPEIYVQRQNIFSARAWVEMKQAIGQPACDQLLQPVSNGGNPRHFEVSHFHPTPRPDVDEALPPMRFEEGLLDRKRT